VDANTVIAICGVVIAVASLVVSAYVAWATRKHNRLSVRPLLGLTISFTMPPPLVWLAVLLLTWVLVRTAAPPLAMPPAAIGGPPAPGAAVAVLPFTWLLVRVRWLVPGGMPRCRSGWRCRPPFKEVLPFTWLLFTVTVPSRFWMPPPPAFGAVLPVTLLLFRVRKLLIPEKPK